MMNKHRKKRLAQTKRSFALKKTGRRGIKFRSKPLEPDPIRRDQTDDFRQRLLCHLLAAILRSLLDRYAASTPRTGRQLLLRQRTCGIFVHATHTATLTCRPTRTGLTFKKSVYTLYCDVSVITVTIQFLIARLTCISIRTCARIHSYTPPSWIR